MVEGLVAIVDAVLRLSVEYLDCCERKADGRSGSEPFDDMLPVCVEQI